MICLLDLLANDCAVQQCFNGATCIDGAQQFVCACADGYRGLRCEAGMKWHNEIAYVSLNVIEIFQIRNEK